MGGNIDKFCGCNNNSTNLKLETSMLSKNNSNNCPKEINGLDIKNSGITDASPVTEFSNKPMTTNNEQLSAIHQRNILVSVTKIIRAYRAYKNRQKRNEVNQNTNTHTSGCFTQSITFDYMGGKDENGLKEGFGVQKWKDGSKYSGMFKQNKASGLGIFIHPDGDKYQGEFENDRANGFGIYVHENGAIYYGQWSDDSQYDIGYEEWTDSSRYSGSYVNGKKDGYGTYLWQDKTKYEGEWKENSIEGYGMYHFSDGRIYTGQWKNNQMHGYGEFLWKEGKKYYGFYSYDKKNGFGIYYWPGDKYYIGFWRDGKQSGLGKYIKGNNIKYGVWVEGKKDKWFASESEFISNLDPKGEKFLSFFKMDLSQIRTFMEIEQ